MGESDIPALKLPGVEITISFFTPPTLHSLEVKKFICSVMSKKGHLVFIVMCSMEKYKYSPSNFSYEYERIFPPFKHYTGIGYNKTKT